MDSDLNDQQAFKRKILRTRRIFRSVLCTLAVIAGLLAYASLSTGHLVDGIIRLAAAAWALALAPMGTVSVTFRDGTSWSTSEVGLMARLRRAQRPQHGR